MTDIQLIHGSDDFYPIQRVHTWGQLNRVDRHIFFLSTGRNSCSDIAYLLKMHREDVRNRLCLLRLLGYVALRTQDGKSILVERILESVTLLQPYHRLCVQYFHDTVCLAFPSVQQYFVHYRITMEQLESQFVIFLRFLVRAIQAADQKIDKMLDSIIQSYRLCTVHEDQYTIIIQCFLEALKYCLQEQWTAELEESWTYLCHVTEYAILAKCQQI